MKQRPVADVLLAVVIGVLLAAAAAHWATCEFC